MILRIFMNVKLKECKVKGCVFDGNAQFSQLASATQVFDFQNIKNCFKLVSCCRTMAGRETPRMRRY